jgi:hypothetical protein
MSRRPERNRAPASLTVTIDPAKQSPSEVLKVTAGLAPLTMVTARMLVDELGGQEQAGAFLAEIAEDIGRPIAVNVPTPTGSRSMFMAPKGWSRDRLAGWVAGKRDEIEQAFGPATLLRLEDL